jgi:hypothetical protein
MPPRPVQRFSLRLMTALAGTLLAGTATEAADTRSDMNLLERTRIALDAGEMHVAESLFTLSSAADGTGRRHLREIVFARLAASRGDWRGCEARLRNWGHDDTRREGSGELLFWQGWAALHQGRDAEGDSLLVLASAYSEEPRAQQALEYRFAALLDNSPVLRDYLRGLPESPLPAPLRLTSLERVPEGSRLHAEARWQLALLWETRGDTLRSRGTLAALSKSPASTAGRRAAVYLAFLRENKHPDSSRTAYEALLLQQQQGVAPEFARKRLQKLGRNGQ